MVSEITSSVPATSKSLEQSVLSIPAWLEQIQSVPSPSTDAQHSLKRKRSNTPITDSSTALEPSPALERPHNHHIRATCSGIVAMSHNLPLGLATPVTTNSTTDSSIFSTPTLSSKGRQKVQRDPGWVGARMDQHGIVCDDGKELERYPHFKQAVENIICSDRGSAMKPESVQRINERREYCRDESEDTILHHLLPLILKSERTRELRPGEKVQEQVIVGQRQAEEQGESRNESLNVDTTQEQLHLSEQEQGIKQQEWVSREWFSDGVFVSRSSDLRGGLLPTQYEDGDFEPELSKLLAKGDGMTTPRPDFCYGLRKDRFPLPPGLILSTEVLLTLQVAPGMQHPFFLIEGKSNKGILGEAENQARRGGATLVNAHRQLLEIIGESVLGLGVDERCFVFSSTITPSVLDIYVHWVEVIVHEPGQEQVPELQRDQDKDHDDHDTNLLQDAESQRMQTIFHMTNLRSYALRNKACLPELRAILHNILEWGCIARVPQLEEFRRKIYAYQRQKTAAMKAEAEASRKENKHKRRRGERS